MTATPPLKNDPRYLREMIERASELARAHEVSCVFVGIAGREGDLLAPEWIDFVESALRVEDSVFRLLRERAVMLLTDVDLDGARSILDRLRVDFAQEFSLSTDLTLALGFYHLKPGESATAKEVLPTIFSGRV